MGKKIIIIALKVLLLLHDLLSFFEFYKYVEENYHYLQDSVTGIIC